MNKDIFYKYDFYTLERKYQELKFIELLDSNSSLNDSIEQFIIDLTNLLYTSIKEEENVRIEEVVLPNIEKELEIFLTEDSLYISYKSHTTENLSEFVLNKFLCRIFEKDGHNNETHVIQGYIHSWLEKKLALNISQDSRFNSLEELKSLINKTEMLHDFHNCIVENIPYDWVLNKKKEWVEISVSSENLLDSIRMYGKDYLDNYVNSLTTQSTENLFKYVQKVTRNSDYMMLNHEFSFVSSVLINKDISLWIEFWDNIKLPVIQDCVFHSFFNFQPQHYLELVSKLIDKKTVLKSDLKILLFIVAQNYFEASNKLTERFSMYYEDERKNERNEQIFQEGIEQQKKWLVDRKENYKSLIQNLNKTLSNSEIEDWIFSYIPRTNSRQFKQNDIYNSEIKLLTETYKENSTELLSSELQSFNLQKFNFHIQVVKDKKNYNSAPILLDALTNYVASDKFFWDRTYAEPYWSALKGLGFVLSRQDKSIEKAKELINKFKSHHQGWNPLKSEYSAVIKETFIFSGVALLFENESAFKNKSEKESFFKELLNLILTQDRYSSTNNTEYYEKPLHLLFLVANQIFSDVKEYCEQELIDTYDNLFSLLAILTNDNFSLSNDSKGLIKKRLDEEFLLEKRKLKNSSKKDKVEELEKMIQYLNL